MSLTSSDIGFLQELIASKSGHVVPDQQAYLFDSKLKCVAQKEGLSSVQELVAKIKKTHSPSISERISEAMTINETLFFRDIHSFDALKNSILPRLIKARQKTKKLSIWNAACSSGQEPYSIAFTIREYFPELSEWKIQILGTDISDEVLEKAEIGGYSQFEVNRGIPASILVKYLERRDSIWFVKDEIRNMLEFRKINLIHPWNLEEKFDLIFMRNVLIYFSVQTKQAVLQRVKNNLAHDGYLVLGGGETMININAPYNRETVDQLVCFRPQS